jgi:hypothetical protein
MTEGPDDPTLERSRAVGGYAERAVAELLERLEDLALWAMEQAAAQPGSDTARQRGSRRATVRRLAAPLPRRAGRLVAGSTYITRRRTQEAARAARELLEETSQRLDQDPTADED